MEVLWKLKFLLFSTIYVLLKEEIRLKPPIGCIQMLWICESWENLRILN